MINDTVLPTTEQVRFGFAYDNRYGEYSDADEADFDRWLTSVKEAAWDEGNAYWQSVPWIDDAPDPRPGNPYRANDVLKTSLRAEHAEVVPSRTTYVNLRDLTDPGVTDPMKAEARADAVASLARTEKVRERNASAAPTIDAREFALFSPDTQQMMLDGGVTVVAPE